MRKRCHINMTTFSKKNGVICGICGSKSLIHNHHFPIQQNQLGINPKPINPTF